MSAPPTSPDTATPSLADRLRNLLPAARALIGKLRLLALFSAAAAAVLWLLLFAGGIGVSPVRTVVSLIVLGILLMPALGTLLAAWTLRDVLALPAMLREMPGQAMETVKSGGAGLRSASGEETPSGGRRVFSFLGVLWRLRAMVRDSKGTLLRVATVSRIARFGSLGFVLLLAVAFVLNFVVIAAAVLAAVVSFLM